MKAAQLLTDNNLRFRIVVRLQTKRNDRSPMEYREAVVSFYTHLHDKVMTKQE
ncbi:hypothetical protein SAMN04487969_1597 [Paenibacillus algorifonticola]|uniref:Uncharacterized protein n=1 Tax=Paenibacillus algorifonticola TaxID=684063 RepID=A0A1I2JAP5_9BACL|nr:hypothetical protein SAMN04487969_1597 [Paenibacillus algorifonticola]